MDDELIEETEEAIEEESNLLPGTGGDDDEEPEIIDSGEEEEATEDPIEYGSAEVTDEDTDDLDDEFDDEDDTETETDNSDEDAEEYGIFDVDFDVDELDDIEEITRTYRMNYAQKRIGGYIDGVEAIGQAVWKILQTRRFAHIIYDDQYGNDLFNKINESSLTPRYIASEVPKMIEEALLADPRILEVVGFKWTKIDDVSVHIEIEVRTTYGQVDLEGVIDSVD